MSDGPSEVDIERRERLVRRACQLMGWPYYTKHVFAGIRKVALAEAIPVGLDKLEEMLNRLEMVEQLTEALRFLHDAQNGPPLEVPSSKDFWIRAMAKAGDALARAEPLIPAEVKDEWG